MTEPHQSLTFEPIHDGRYDELEAFLVSEPWEYFGRADLTADVVRAQWDGGDYRSPEAEGFLVCASGEVVGVVRLFDLEDPTTLFDVRLARRVRGRGYGSVAVRWVADRMFGIPHVHKVHANTRDDNAAMRVTLLRCGFVKEGHYRASSPDERDWVAYGLLRSDWRDGTITPLIWDDEPALDGRPA